jgi:hypothetical protein
MMVKVAKVVKIPEIAKTAGWQQYDSLDHCARAAGLRSVALIRP